MTLAILTVPDHPTFDVLRGAAAVVAFVLIASCSVIAALLARRGPVVPSWVRYALGAWILGDTYVAARELVEIGRPLFLFGLPLALAWELCALAYLRRLWTATGGLRHRPAW